LSLSARRKKDTSIEFGPVTVEFGENGEVKTATGGLGAWQSTGRVSSSAIGGQPLTISAFASASYRRADLPDGEDIEVVFGSGEVVVILAQTPPELTVDDFPTEVTPPSLPYRLQLHGTAIDPGSGVSVVQYKINEGAFANVDNLNGNWSSWAAGDRVFDLWNARKVWIEQKLAAIEAQRSQGFEQVIHTFIGNIDLTALAAQDATGADITPTLDAVNLDLDAFRFLAKCRELATAGGLSINEIVDIVSIVLQVQKKRQYQQWRGEEFGISLSPQYFQLPDDGAGSISNPTTIPWRVPVRAYTAWRKTLDTRIKQLQEVKDSYQFALDAAEAKVMPALRDNLIQGQAGPLRPDASATAV
jgi:hypothetical protein